MKEVYACHELAYPKKSDFKQRIELVDEIGRGDTGGWLFQLVTKLGLIPINDREVQIRKYFYPRRQSRSVPFENVDTSKRPTEATCNLFRLGFCGQSGLPCIPEAGMKIIGKSKEQD